MQLSWEIQGSGRLSDSFKVTEILFLKKRMPLSKNEETGRN